MRVAPLIQLSAEEEQKLRRLARSNTTSVRLARRARIVLLAAAGLDNQAIAAQINIGRVQVGRWRERYAQGGLEAIEHDLPRGGRPPRVDAAEIVRRTTQTLPDAATQWSTRTLARDMGVSDTTVLRVWRAHGLKPHLVRGFKVSRDPKFVEKLEDIVGLYMSPPDHALVLCCDEKSQVQALDRTQPGLPLKTGRAATLTHDYKRNGTTTLFAALNILDGQVIGQCQQRHTHAGCHAGTHPHHRRRDEEPPAQPLYRRLHRANLHYWAGGSDCDWQYSRAGDRVRLSRFPGGGADGGAHFIRPRNLRTPKYSRLG